MGFAVRKGRFGSGIHYHLAMIARLKGQLVDVSRDRALVELPVGVSVEVLLPSFVATRLAVATGQPVSLHTLCFFESSNQGTTIFPRLAGFLAAEDLRFFELLVTVKGIGYRKALRAMVLDTATLASAIADRDLKLLQTMPEVGRKLAETIVVTLKDKVDKFVSAASYPGGSASGDGSGARGSTSGGRGGGLAREALEVLLQLGEARADAVMLIDRVLASKEPPADVQGVVEAVYRLKAG